MEEHSPNPNVSGSGTVRMEEHSPNPNVRRTGTVRMDVHSPNPNVSHSGTVRMDLHSLNPKAPYLVSRRLREVKHRTPSLRSGSTTTAKRTPLSSLPLLCSPSATCFPSAFTSSSLLPTPTLVTSGLSRLLQGPSVSASDSAWVAWEACVFRLTRGARLCQRGCVCTLWLRWRRRLRLGWFLCSLTGSSIARRAPGCCGGVVADSAGCVCPLVCFWWGLSCRRRCLRLWMLPHRPARLARWDQLCAAKREYFFYGLYVRRGRRARAPWAFPSPARALPRRRVRCRHWCLTRARVSHDHVGVLPFGHLSCHHCHESDTVPLAVRCQ